MILRLAELALLGSVFVRLLTGQWPWDYWKNRDVRREERQARTLLGVAANAPREDIIDAHRKLLSRVHPDKGGTNEAVYEANAARDLLLERLAPRKRA
ncbi:heat shock protein DnaJ-like protein [Novosphingobium nitrogenifigens DSM 19370]|uniref:Heat shock protein DnaJ-like protein n=1 Tax=Novosphingobium nitrogenifigens DSM 19370 TaxID=983920 RepID=F1Z5B2_9SPHN|nr:hypothetical protein [Novosphingobium nitrogenifigens]EGD60290.1 heat shock protein DnaJ-like protein [Novosphingobium nitrogenifigens DSM 19370]